MYGTTNFCGCGNQYPIVPGSNPSLVTWDGQKFIVSDGSNQLPINLPYIQHSNLSNSAFILGATAQGVLTKLQTYTVNINYLLIGGGGASGDSAQAGNGAGGGGAGGLIQSTFSIRFAKTIHITVGSGGISKGQDQAGGNGGNSIISYDATSISAIGGGGGGGDITPYLNGSNGGSGGGSGTDGGSVGTIGIATAGQGFNGGVSNLFTGNSGGGGGGAGSAGGSPFNSVDNTYGGSGGNGLASSITGTSIYYAAGGCGNSADIAGTNGLGWPNYGSGGNIQYQGDFSNPGYSGVCILSIPTQYFSGAYTNATVTTNGSNTILTFTGNGTYTT
jgi:hypothetical protein